MIRNSYLNRAFNCSITSETRLLCCNDFRDFMMRTIAASISCRRSSSTLFRVSFCSGSVSPYLNMLRKFRFIFHYNTKRFTFKHLNVWCETRKCTTIQFKQTEPTNSKSRNLDEPVWQWRWEFSLYATLTETGRLRITCQSFWFHFCAAPWAPCATPDSPPSHAPSTVTSDCTLSLECLQQKYVKNFRTLLDPSQK